MLSLHAVRSYDRDALKLLLAPLLDAALPPSGSVLLKPNFVMPARLGDASVTHPDFYMSVAKVLVERGLRVGIGESPAVGSCTQALRAHGVLDECRALGVEVVEFKQPRTYAGVEDGGAYKTLSIAAELEQWDALVNLPKLKTHQQFVFTAATKNLYGCVTGKRKFVRHNLCANDPVHFARMLLANASEARCVLHLCDAIEALHVRGPRGGKPFALGRVIASTDHLAHDWLCCHLIGLDPASTPLFRALDEAERARIAQDCESIVSAADFEPAHDFQHANLVHISFSPWAIARSGVRRLRHALAPQVGGS